MQQLLHEVLDVTLNSLAKPQDLCRIPGFLTDVYLELEHCGNCRFYHMGSPSMNTDDYRS